MAYVGLVAENSLDFIDKLFKSYIDGIPVVFLRNNSDYERIEKFNLEEIYAPLKKFGWFSFTSDLPIDYRTAHIAFTSGTENSPKGVELTHENLNDVAQRLNFAMETNEEICEYVGIPANYSFGIGRFRAIAAVGGRAYLPPNGFDLLEIRQLLLEKRINAISAVPSLLRILLKGQSMFGDEVNEVRWIEIGSQFMADEEKKALVTFFPKAKILQHYGLTEASRTSLLRLDLATKSQLASVGRAYGETEIKISENGRISIRGPHVAEKYFMNGEFKSIKNSEGWYVTNDLGHIEEGYLYYDGRADDLINCGGVKLSPDAIEHRIRMAMVSEFHFGVTRIPDKTYGDAILLCYTIGNDELNISKFKKIAYHVVEELGLKNKNAVFFHTLVSLPTTETGKIKRSELSALFARNESLKSVANVEARIASSKGSDFSEKQILVFDFLRKIIPIPADTDLDSSFYDLGGDSLSALNAIIELERMNAPPAISKGIMQGMTIREIAENLEVPSDAKNSSFLEKPAAITGFSINVVRGMLALCVVLAHWSEGIFERLAGGAYISKIIAPLLGIGTPGFSVIYGTSIGYALFQVFVSDESRFLKIRRKTLRLLSMGILVLALFQSSEIVAKHGHLSSVDFFSSFYSVLSYYWLITLSVGMLFSFVKKNKHPELTLLLIAIVSYGIDRFIMPSFYISNLGGLLELVKLLFVGKYGYFNMLTGTCLGLVAGFYFYKMKNRTDKSIAALIYSGSATVLLGLIVSYHASDFSGWAIWPVYTNTIWRWLVYSGVVFILLGSVHFFVRTKFCAASVIARLILQFFAVCGILAFPLFIAHEVVLPAKNILVLGLSFSNSTALLLCMTLFVVGFGYAVRRVHNVAFSQN